MKKRKLPIVLVTALVVLLGGAFVFNVISHRSADDEANASEQGKDPSKATGNDAKDISAKDLKANVASQMRIASASKTATLKKPHGIRMEEDEPPSEASGPMVLAEPSGNKLLPRPNRRPGDARGVGQWYTDTSSVKAGK